MLGIIKLNDLVAASFGHSLHERIVVGLRDYPELRDERLVSEVRRLSEIVKHFKSVEEFGVTRWEGIYIQVPREDLAALQSMYPDDDQDDLESLIKGQYAHPFYLLEFSLFRDGDLFSLRSESPHFSIIFDFSKDAFLVPPKVTSHERSLEYKTLAGEIIAALQGSLEEALTDSVRYSTRVKEQLPYENRIGRIKRADLIEIGIPASTSLTTNEVEQFLKAAPKLAQGHPLSLSRDDYLTAVQIALHAIGKAELGEPLTKSYQSNADGRDGGMLGLSPRSTDEFFRWVNSREWHGQHPFEIVRGFHGHTAIRLYVTPSNESRKVELMLCGSWEGVADKVVRMALALYQAGISITLAELERHKARVSGEDWLLVSESSGLDGEDWQDIEFDRFNGIVGGQISYWELAERPDALKCVTWNDPIIIQPLSEQCVSVPSPSIFNAVLPGMRQQH